MKGTLSANASHERRHEITQEISKVAIVFVMRHVTLKCFMSSTVIGMGLFTSRHYGRHEVSRLNCNFGLLLS